MNVPYPEGGPYSSFLWSRKTESFSFSISSLFSFIKLINSRMNLTGPVESRRGSKKNLWEMIRKDSDPDF
jgi:hypothetical protein